VDGANNTGVTYVAVERADLATWRLFLRVSQAVSWVERYDYCSALLQLSFGYVWLWMMPSRKRWVARQFSTCWVDRDVELSSNQ
jgi:hypothetical protein